MYDDDDDEWADSDFIDDPGILDPINDLECKLHSVNFIWLCVVALQDVC